MLLILLEEPPIMTKVLVTGCAGFMGSHVVNCCIEQGYEVVGLDDLSGGFEENVNPQATFVKGDILDHALVSKLFEDHQFTYVYHLAAYAAEGLSQFIKRYNYNNNLIGSVNLINESIKHKVKCFVFTSSIAVYGTNQLPMTEELTPMPEDSYGIAKYAVEQELKASHEMFGLNYVIFRPHNVYGVRQNISDPFRNVIGIFMRKILEGEPMTIFGDGEQTRAFTCVNDITPIIVDSVKNKEAYQEVFNIGATQPYSVNALAEQIAQAMGKELKVTHLPARNEVLHAYADHQKVEKMLGYQDKTSLEDGITEMAQWVMSLSELRPTSKFTEIELTEGLPPVWLQYIT